MMARDEGWLAEHMLILGVEVAAGREDLCGGRLPQRLRQDQLRHADPAAGLDETAGRSPPSATTSPGSSPAPDGKLYAINPEAGYLRRRARHLGARSNPNAMASIREQHDLHQRGAHRRRRCVVGRDDQGAAGAPDRLARPGLDARLRPATRRTPTRASPRRPSQCPSIDPDWENPQGVPIAAFIFGGRRSERRAAGLPVLQLDLRRLPGRDDGLGDDGRGRRRRSARCGATRSRCCRSAATTWPTTSTTGCSSGARSPTRRASSASTGSARTSNGNFLWPGFGENMRILKWIVERAQRPRRQHRKPAGLDAALRGSSTGRGLEDFSRGAVQRADVDRPRRRGSRRSCRTRSCSSSCTTGCPRS